MQRKTLRQLAAESANPPPPSQHSGVACPHCGGRELPAHKTMRDMKRTIRYRRCASCGQSVMTREEVVRPIVPVEISPIILPIKTA